MTRSRFAVNSRPSRPAVTVAAASLALLLTACGSDADVTDDVAPAPDESTSASSGAPNDEADTAESDAQDDIADDVASDAASDAAEYAESVRDNLEKVQEERGGGSATLIVGDERWEFDAVLCAFGEEEIGQEDAEFVLSAMQDGLQFYVTIDAWGHSFSLNDVADFENPSINLFSVGDDFIQLDGKESSGEAGMVDDTGIGDPTPASFEAVCP